MKVSIVNVNQLTPRNATISWAESSLSRNKKEQWCNFHACIISLYTPLMNASTDTIIYRGRQ